MPFSMHAAATGSITVAVKNHLNRLCRPNVIETDEKRLVEPLCPPRFQNLAKLVTRPLKSLSRLYPLELSRLVDFDDHPRVVIRRDGFQGRVFPSGQNRE